MTSVRGLTSLIKMVEKLKIEVSMVIIKKEPGTGKSISFRPTSPFIELPTIKMKPLKVKPLDAAVGKSDEPFTKL